jgi:hypothetical protein
MYPVLFYAKLNILLTHKVISITTPELLYKKYKNINLELQVE